MQTVLTNELKPFLDAVAQDMELYVPKKMDKHYVYSRYDSTSKLKVKLNNIRACTPVKEFLFPMRELAAIYPEPAEPLDIKPFAVFGLKYCDLRSIEILDRVFAETEFEDALYMARRDKMFIISSDCTDPADSCFCNVLGGKPFAQSGFDLNVSQVTDQLVIEIGSQKGRDFVEKHPELFTDTTQAILDERDKIREKTKQQLEQINESLRFDSAVNKLVENSYDSFVYDEEAKTCVECQACTRVCPTCHCFYLYDDKQKDYFTKMKMWDSCMRMAYSEVAGGANPRKALGARLRHRFMHKFSYYLERYGIEMCVGCGRCVDSEAGDVDIRRVLKKLNEELKGKDKTRAELAK
ncbi:MAG: 4Fe-4S dicluster domain-containing protein [Sedimentisphaerales bacterium]|nr:4Fe-4S dicluster domain-containing protein [Sedimentisphaerales bacterium]